MLTKEERQKLCILEVKIMSDLIDPLVHPQLRDLHDMYIKFPEKSQCKCYLSDWKILELKPMEYVNFKTAIKVRIPSYPEEPEKSMKWKT